MLLYDVRHILFYTRLLPFRFFILTTIRLESRAADTGKRARLVQYLYLRDEVDLCTIGIDLLDIVQQTGPRRAKDPKEEGGAGGGEGGGSLGYTARA